jgi:putrescine importer
LKRILNLRDLIIYGMIILQVVGPLPTFGLLAQRSDNHAVATALLAMFPMLVTAVSYGRMARLYPTAGSAYTYVGQTFSPHLGFLIGWSMLLDYWMILLISALIPALAVHRLLPPVPLTLLAFLVIVAMTGLNLRGMRTTLRANQLLLIAASLAVLAFLFCGVAYLVGHTGWQSVLTTAPLYDRHTFRSSALMAGISLAAITYIGFDGLTTLAEDSIDPKRDMVRAPVIVVLITGLLCAVELYFMQAVIPDWHVVDPNTAYLDVMRIVGGSSLFLIFLVVMSLSQFGSGLSVQASVARLLYGMGRDNALPRALFGYLSPARRHPARNILFVGVLAYVGTFFISFEQACDFLNFGAFLGFMGVNLSAAWRYYCRPPVDHKRQFLWDLLIPLSGFFGCLLFWLGLPLHAKYFGGAWLLLGLIYCALKTRGFRERPLKIDYQKS